MLEAELATICPVEGSMSQLYGSNQEKDLHKLRLLLERECAAQVNSSHACRFCTCIVFTQQQVTCTWSVLVTVLPLVCSCRCMGWLHGIFKTSKESADL